MRTPLSILFTALLFTLPAQAELRSKPIHYHDGEVPLEGHLVWDDSFEGKRPGVMVVHEWWGLNDYARGRAEQLAKQGYVAFAADMYGNRQVTEHPKQAQGWMKTITANTDAWRQRALLGLDQLKQQDAVDPERLAAIGYCFGGATVMQMAYAGADLDAVVSLHGSLPVASEQDGANIKSRILAVHGDADAFVPQPKVDAFSAALDDAGANWQMLVFGGVRHAFTNPNAGKYGIENLKYDRQADVLSWQYLLGFLDDALTTDAE